MLNIDNYKGIKKALKEEGKAVIKFYDKIIEILFNGIGETEISCNNEYLFTATNWYEVKDYLLDVQEAI
jgi:hypothetical protein